MTALLEREHELREIHILLEEVKGGQGRALAIEAGAGLGKTCLLHEARSRASGTGVEILSARATELEADFPFSLVRQLFEPRFAALSPREGERLLEGAAAARAPLGLASDYPGEHDSFAVLHALYWVTAALSEDGPLLLAIDDLHWADAASLDYLSFLLPRLEELPVLVLLTARPADTDPGSAAGRVLVDPAVRCLTPAPLTVEATRELLFSELDIGPDQEFTATCHEVTGGNPFLLSEVVRAVAERNIAPNAGEAELVRELAPEGVARMVLTRLSGLSSEAGTLARALSVLGDDNAHGSFAELAGLEPKLAEVAADQLRVAAIFDDSGSPRFTHPLVRNAIYADLSAGQRARTHARAATILRKRGASVEQIATQFLAGRPSGDAETVQTLLDAGERALANGAPNSAIAYMERALQEPPSPQLRVSVLDQLITASFHAGDPSAFNRIEAEVWAELERDRSLRSRWAVPLTALMAIHGRFEEAASMLGDAVEAALAEADVERAFQLEAHLSTMALFVPTVPEVNLERFIDHIEPDSPAGRLAAAMEVRSAAVNGTAAEAADAAKRALANDGVIFAEEPELAASGVAVMTLVTADEIEAAGFGAERALAIADEGARSPPQMIRGWFLRGFVAWGRGDLIAAEADLRQAISLARMAGILPLVMMFTPALVEILIERDELVAAEAEIQGLGIAAGPLPANPASGILLMARGHLRWEQGRSEEAAEDFAAVAAVGEELGLGLGPTASVAPWAVAGMVMEGRRQGAIELAEELVGWARRWAAPASIAHVLRALAIARGGTEAVALLEEAVATLNGSLRRLERIHALVDLGAVLRAQGCRVEARVPLREALQLARRCGAARAGARARDELQATGETVRRYAPLGVESLTPSERRVADLAASGLTNRQIAQSLFVTVKTVEAHLSATYDKLDIRSRRDLGDVLTSSGER